ncbi:hypothetical protein [Agrobacterium rubi]|uniref:Periplasmic protein n=1 Tax=Agrobacterium rubi TaxID=28099 RepID=A0AAE7RAV4_9HYPH|nr:hypothetical protein [Agrobacterium rubi]NTE88401.1 hypothetical protein [Agrobacterium rubi]NTF04167.1 hypothetical protein [Agrobacterium rubi]NTF09581.1 hypothetical protein [Agrobacterium rubi]NTF22488.1 hypothetical protein [Agrobacterium rubi]NTF29345.1 hypothetical protein [Agrobacterium rubi]
MKPASALKAVISIDDGVLMRGAFYVLLAAAAAFLVIDIREISTAEAARPGLETLPDVPTFLPPTTAPGAPGAPPVQPSSPEEVLRKPMTFNLVSGGVLVAEGTIDPGAAGRFANEVEARGEYIKLVSLNSPGGSVDDAVAMSKLIREKNIATKVAEKALCASSCPIVFAGGVTRSAEKDAVVGVHQVFNGGIDRPSPDQAMSSVQATTARVARHLDEMGIGAGLWIHALETPPNQLYYLTPAEMAKYRLTTDATPAATPSAG